MRNDGIKGGDLYSVNGNDRPSQISEAVYTVEHYCEHSRSYKNSSRAQYLMELPGKLRKFLSVHGVHLLYQTRLFPDWVNLAHSIQ